MLLPRFTVRRMMAVVAAFAAVIALIALLYRSPEDTGAAEAERDIASGILRLKTYGLPSPWYPQYEQLMKARLGVEIRGVAGCVIDDGLRRNVEGYNTRMLSEITRRFGAVALKKVVDDAQSQPY